MLLSETMKPTRTLLASGHPSTDPEADDQAGGHGDLQKRPEHGDFPVGAEFSGRDLHADEEQQQQNADGAETGQELRVGHHPEHAGAHDHAGDDVPDRVGLADDARHHRRDRQHQDNGDKRQKD